MRPCHHLLLLALGLLLAGCASVPDVEGLLSRPATAKPEIVGTRGPLTAKQSQAVLKRAGVKGRELTALERHLAIEQEVAETPLVVGNRTHFLRDGEDTFRAMFAAIRGAKDHVNLEYYILEDISSDGVMLSELLVEKAQAGVAINIIYDSYGSGSTPDAFFNKLKAAGITLVSFNPMNPFKARAGYKPNDRDHRKILVADGRIGIVGGINMSTTYLSSSPSRLGKSGAGGGGEAEPGEAAAGGQTARANAEPVDYWRDVDLEIEGPVVAQLQRLFLAHWAAQKGPPLNEANFFPKVPTVGNEVMRIIGSTPERGIPRYYVTLLSAIRNADKNVFVTAAYFVPTRAEKRDLIAAARRGVDVRLLLPGKSDSHLSLAAQRSLYGGFFEAGVKVFEVRDYIQHTKMVSVDGVWTVIGSSNFDHRSVLYNDEVDAVVLGTSTAADMEKLFTEDMNHAVPVDPAAWRHRPLGERLFEGFARIWTSLL